MIDKIKKPLLKAITILATRFPEPTRELTNAPNTHRFLEIKDKFFEFEDNKGRNALFRAIWKIFIWVYEHDKYYRHRIDWVIEQIIELNNQGFWQPREPRKPSRHWKEFK